MSRLRTQDGFTLVEVMVAMVLALVIFGSVIEGFVRFLSSHAKTDRTAQAQDSARSALDEIARQLRNSQGAGVTQPVWQVNVQGTEIVFLMPSDSSSVSLTNNPQGLLWVRYCIDYSSIPNQKLWMQTLPYDSVNQPSPPFVSTCPSASYTVQRPVADHLVNRQGGKTTGCPCPSTNLFSAALDPYGQRYDVKMDALVDVDVNQSPAATEVKSSIHLRNANRSPIPSLTCQATATKHILCDASASYDPDGQPVTFEWQQYACGSYTGSVPPNTCPWVPGQTSYTFDSGVQSSGTHYVTVGVVDPAGLEADGQTTVSIP
jgi:prepilin-type N-terminal cleavage/methylation domain-containing protein